MGSLASLVMILLWTVPGSAVTHYQLCDTSEQILSEP